MRGLSEGFIKGDCEGCGKGAGVYVLWIVLSNDINRISILSLINRGSIFG